ncbi:Protein of unknown function [Marinospirillum celere]|uniref:DUF2442 domain-containing protein n=1 Tax=Marinospirillum celere TaxID=1122252 RepID=A0A1I1E8H2_9GAMM|nr:DUF2442 domain-containing protein [Marinospirillum celere]SFB83425.1 Protein of unknown function [Marinospirillum celere]
MIKILSFHFLENNHLFLEFSDGSKGIFDLPAYLAKKQGPLLEPLKDEGFLKRAFLDAGALSWPHGLELSPDRLHELTQKQQAA